VPPEYSKVSGIYKVWVVFIDVDIWGKSGLSQLYTAVREVAMSVINRAQVLVYDVLADSMMRSLE
jgi:hypothetical protein